MRKIISALLAVQMLLSSSVLAAEGVISEIVNNAGNITVGNDELPVQAEYTYEPPVIKQEVPYHILSGDEDEAREVSENDVITLSTDTDNETLWKTMLAEQLHGDYLSLYRQTEGVDITGDTNRLVIKNTDLKLEGKHGLDVVLTRKYDSQYNRKSYKNRRNSSGLNSYNHRYYYTFVNEQANEEIGIAFETPDDFYMYMYDGCYITEFNTNYMKTYEGHNYYFYEHIKNWVTEEATDIHLVHNPEGDKFEFNYVYYNSTYYDFDDISMLKNGIHLGNGWYIDMPYVFKSRYDYVKTTGSTYKKYERYYNGALRDINGNVTTFFGDSTVVNYDSGTSYYEASYYCDDESYICSSYYLDQTLGDTGITYNFVVCANNDLTYYFICNNVTSGSPVMYIKAIVNKYGDMISYQYAEDSISQLVSITDTYGRVITINNIDSGKRIDYPDDLGQTRSITYLNSEPDIELNNNNPLKNKEVSMFTYTNESGESTKYYTREYIQPVFRNASGSTKISDFDYSSYVEFNATVDGYLIEKIKYPNGKETDFNYKRLFEINGVTKITKGLFAIIGHYDTVNGEKTNSNEYEISASSSELTVKHKKK